MQPGFIGTRVVGGLKTVVKSKIKRNQSGVFVGRDHRDIEEERAHQRVSAEHLIIVTWLSCLKCRMDSGLSDALCDINEPE